LSSLVFRSTAEEVLRLASASQLSATIAAELGWVGHGRPTSERRSWDASLPLLAQCLVDVGLDDVDMLIKYRLPESSCRADVILAGVHPNRRSQLRSRRAEAVEQCRTRLEQRPHCPRPGPFYRTPAPRRPGIRLLKVLDGVRRSSARATHCGAWRHVFTQCHREFCARPARPETR
jgi:hypothetical protein